MDTLSVVKYPHPLGWVTIRIEKKRVQEIPNYVEYNATPTILYVYPSSHPKEGREGWREYVEVTVPSTAYLVVYAVEEIGEEVFRVPEVTAIYKNIPEIPQAVLQEAASKIAAYLDELKKKGISPMLKLPQKLIELINNTTQPTKQCNDLYCIADYVKELLKENNAILVYDATEDNIFVDAEDRSVAAEILEELEARGVVYFDYDACRLTPLGERVWELLADYDLVDVID